MWSWWHHAGVSDAISVATAEPRVLAAVRRSGVRPGTVGQVFGSALDEVWAFLGSQPGLHAGGHNVFLYHHPAEGRDGSMDIDFGVEVSRRFDGDGSVACIETPGGRTVVAVHRGSYHRLPATHAAIHEWCRVTGQQVGAWSMEIYGDWHDDESKLETTIVYALR
jgi:effector-binding domain-containing protein